MNISELKSIIKDLPDNMPVGLIDLTTDDDLNSGYDLKSDNIFVDDYCEPGNEEIIGQMLFISFRNKLNENPL